MLQWGRAQVRYLHRSLQIFQIFLAVVRSLRIHTLQFARSLAIHTAHRVVQLAPAVDWPEGRITAAVQRPLHVGRQAQEVFDDRLSVERVVGGAEASNRLPFRVGDELFIVPRDVEVGGGAHWLGFILGDHKGLKATWTIENGLIEDRESVRRESNLVEQITALAIRGARRLSAKLVAREGDDGEP